MDSNVLNFAAINRRIYADDVRREIGEHGLSDPLLVPIALVEYYGSP